MKKIIAGILTTSLTLTIAMHTIAPIDYTEIDAVTYAPLIEVYAYAISESQAVELDGSTMYVDDGFKLEKGYGYLITFKNDTMISIKKL